MNRMITYKEIVPELLSLVPDLKTKYAEMNADFGVSFTEKDLDDLQQIEKAHDLQVTTNSVGPSIVFENLFVPYLLGISGTNSNSTKLSEIMNWVEELSSSEVFEVSNLVAGSFCEPLLASHEDKLPALYPLMGKRTKELCRMQFSRFIVSDATKKMFDN